MAGNGGSAPETTRPNIIFVLVDDLGWGDLGVFYQNERAGGQKHQTPQLDQLAAEGLQMRRHYTPAPVCAPARASLLLGVHQGHANVRDNQFDKTLEDNHTLGNVLQRAGYATANIGKYGLQGPGAPAAQPSRPGLRGFDYFFGYLSHKAAHNHYPALLQGMDDQGQPNAFFEGTTDIRSELAKSYSTDLFTARAKKWIVDQHTARPEQPFFLYLAYTAPHSQLQLPTDSHLTATSNYPKGGGLEGGVQWQGKAGAMINTATGAVDAGMHPDYASKGWPDSAKRHATLVRRLDDAMADLITLLKDLSIDEETLIVFTSDNGPTNESRDPQFFRSYGPFEGIKRDVLEGGIRVPTLVRWPSHVPAGGVSHAPSQFHDWMPTFAELAGVPQPARSDGVSLVPTLTGQGTQPESTVYVEYQYAGKTPSYADFANHAGDQRQQMQVILSGGYKALRTSIASGTTPFRLYDPEEDPGEGMDLFGANGAPTAAQIMTRVATVRRPNASAPRPYDAVQLPAEAHATSPGLSFRAFEQQTPWVPNWSTFSPAGQGEAPELDLSVRTRDDDIGLLFTGYLDVPSAGEYTFFLRTDTGAFVRLHDAQLLDADYGYEGGSEVSSGAIALDAGLHPITIHYRHGTTAEHALSLAWQGPGMAKEPVPSSAWLH